mmetsp:Transcript_1035/g.2645  ORF Transcript_1035/g.2645 Transcript_1035/m.2645 type:complete len:136 (+) Transcript_1035:1245-1652(+)
MDLISGSSSSVDIVVGVRLMAGCARVFGLPWVGSALRPGMGNARAGSGLFFAAAAAGEGGGASTMPGRLEGSTPEKASSGGKARVNLDSMSDEAIPGENELDEKPGVDVGLPVIAPTGGLILSARRGKRVKWFEC